MLEHVHGPGKWIRTGDVQRFGVRVNGMADVAHTVPARATEMVLVAAAGMRPASGDGPVPGARPEAPGPARSPRPGANRREIVRTRAKAGVQRRGIGAQRRSMQALPMIPGLPSLSAEAAQGVVPWPWEPAVARKRAKPVRWVSPLDGAGGLPLVGAGIGTLLGALWLIGTVQRRRKRKT
ncbi:hypothetical protein [Nonomuraea sp. NPDC049784]|uniref:hypothetical protein n=1 Tax=Nonomuraea sp. NPDC049784 TaxID=3154361 RepID=UPI003400F607